VAAWADQPGRGCLDDVDAVPFEHRAAGLVTGEPVPAGQHGDAPCPVEKRGGEADQSLVPAVGDDIATGGVEAIARGAVERGRAVVRVELIQSRAGVRDAGGE